MNRRSHSGKASRLGRGMAEVAGAAEVLGAVPGDVEEARWLARVKRLLAASPGVPGRSIAAGLPSPGCRHGPVVPRDAMTPGAHARGGAGLTVHWAVRDTPFGAAVFAATGRGLCALHFVEEAGTARVREVLEARWPEARLCEDPRRLAPFAREVVSRMRGCARRRLTLAPGGSAFQLRVWEALLGIPEGEVVTYGELAERIGAPRAARAIGSAVAANPIAYLVPCHRVVRASGAIGEYRWGSRRKAAMLAVELARAGAAAVASS